MKTKIHISLIWLLVICMVIMLLPGTTLAAYSDVQDHWAQSAIDKWSDLGIVQGSNGTFRPNDPITRGEMAVIINRVMQYQTTAQNSFTDLGDAYYTDAILKTNAAGVIEGNGVNVRPTDIITREEATVMLGRALGLTESATAASVFSDRGSISSWAVGYVNSMVNKGYVQGFDGAFNPQSSITRSEVVTILNNAIKSLYNEAKEYTGDVSGSVVVNTAGVVLNNMKIKGDLIIAEGVGSGDVTLNNVTVLGQTIIRGGGANSIHIQGNSQIGNIIIEKTDDGAVRVVTSDGATVDGVFVDDGNDDIILTGSFDSITVAADASVKLVDAEIEEMEVTASGASVDVDADTNVSNMTVTESAQASVISVSGTVTKLQNDAPQSSITVSGTVATLSAGYAAVGSSVNITSGAKVTTLTTDANISVDNKGTITNAQINANGVTLDGNHPVNVNVDSKVTILPVDSDGNIVSDGDNSSSTGGGGGSTILVSAITVTGDAVVGATLTTNVSPSNATNVTYQWQANTGAGGAFVNISGATSSTYVIPADLLGNTIRVIANGDNSSTATSDATAEVAATSPLASYTPVTLTQTGDVANGNVQYADAAAVIAALPTEIAVTLDDASVVNVPVTWADTDTYDAATAADYTFTAIWGTMPAGANNDNSLAVPTVEVTVAP